MERLSYYNPNINFDRKALTEVWEILNAYEEDISEIPEKHMWTIEDNMDKDYVFVVNDFEKIELREDTKKIITYLYTNFLSTPEERTILKELEKVQYEKKKHTTKEVKSVEYNTFYNNKLEERIEFSEEPVNYMKDKLEQEYTDYKEEQNNQKSLVKYEESFLVNIINKIKEIFKNILK